MTVLINPYRYQVTAAQNIFQILTTLGYTTNLQFALDAGEGDSYTSGQKWLDLTANDQDFFLGADVAATATDPTFNGVADTLSSAEFFSFDDGDYFRYDGANETWMNDISKDNALLSWAFWVYLADLASTQIIFTTSNTSAGATLQVVTSGSVQFVVLDGAGSNSFIDGTTATVSAGAWTYLGGSIDEAGNTDVLAINGTTEVGVGAYTTPSASNGSILQLGARSTGALSINAGGRMAIGCMWSGTALSAAQLKNIYAMTKGRFGV